MYETEERQILNAVDKLTEILEEPGFDTGSFTKKDIEEMLGLFEEYSREISNDSDESEEE